ncbi:MAG: hypothetical protein L0154_13755 [Chloroflexi bacterium]|nr:hypothetical protein [Chloroflexota bacterium]
MAELKHTDFMNGLTKIVPDLLPKQLQDFKYGNTNWLFQMYYGRDKGIHYEISRVWNKTGRVLEVGLHFESCDRARNQQLIEYFQRYIFEIRETLGEQIVAEQWDRGWTKIYEVYPSEQLTSEHQQFAAQRLATFIETIQPLYKHIRAKA